MVVSQQMITNQWPLYTLFGRKNTTLKQFFFDCRHKLGGLSCQHLTGNKLPLERGLEAMTEKARARIPFRERAKIASGALIEVVAPILREVVDYADNTFWRCREVAERPDREDHAPLALYRHIIEMGDGIETLISQGCSGPSSALLRSCFEPCLALKYIVKENYEPRSLAWLCSYLHSEIELKGVLDRDTKKGEKLASALQKEAPEILEKLRPARCIGELQEALAEPHFAEMEAKYQRLKEKSGRPPYWCALVGGPKSLPELAYRLSWGAPYQVFYGPWSTLIHGFDASRFVEELSDGNVEFKPLRDPAELKRNACLAEWFVSYATKSMIRSFLPEEAEKFIKWESDINKRLERLDRFVLKYSVLP